MRSVGIPIEWVPLTRAPPVDSSLSGVQDDRDRTIVYQADLHPGAEDAGLDFDAKLAQDRAEALVQRLRKFGPGGSRERRPIALRGVGDQRELADDDTAKGNRPSFT